MLTQNQTQSDASHSLQLGGVGLYHHPILNRGRARRGEAAESIHLDYAQTATTKRAQILVSAECGECKCHYFARAEEWDSPFGTSLNWWSIVIATVSLCGFISGFLRPDR